MQDEGQQKPVPVFQVALLVVPHHMLTLTLCKAQVFHPNIDVDGNICLNILREDWKPVLSISSIIYGLQFLFLVKSSTSS